MDYIAFPKGALELSKCQLVAQGGERLVFQSDFYPDLLFKVQKETSQRKLKKWDLKSVLLRCIPSFKNYIVLRENKGFVNLCMNGSLPIERIPVSPLYGFVDSDKGTAQVVRKISVDGKNIGPTLSALLKDGKFGNQEISALNQFASDLLISQIPTNDMHSSNIVLGIDVSGKLKFVLVDGIGDIHLLPIRTYSQTARKSHLVKRFKRLGGSQLKFDTKTFSFTLMTD